MFSPTLSITDFGQAPLRRTKTNQMSKGQEQMSPRTQTSASLDHVPCPAPRIWNIHLTPATWHVSPGVLKYTQKNMS